MQSHVPQAVQCVNKISLQNSHKSAHAFQPRNCFENYTLFAQDKIQGTWLTYFPLNGYRKNNHKHAQRKEHALIFIDML